jgi:hypothetical protein
MQILGTPTPENWPVRRLKRCCLLAPCLCHCLVAHCIFLDVVQGVDALPDYSKLVLPTLRPLPLASVLPAASPLAIDLLSNLLVYDPSQRVRASKVRQVPRPVCHRCFTRSMVSSGLHTAISCRFVFFFEVRVVW